MNEYQSIFMPTLNVDIANYITELIIANYLKYRKKPMPASPFWRKEISKNDAWLTELSNKYSLELTAVKDLLTVFSPTVVTSCITKRNLGTLKFLNKELKQEIVSELFKEQVKFIRSLECINKRELERADNKLPFTGTVNINVGNKKKIGGL